MSSTASVEAKRFRLFSNLRPMAGVRTARFSPDHELVVDADTPRGVLRLFLAASRDDALLINSGGRGLLMLCALRHLFSSKGPKLVCLDLILPRPANAKGRALAWLRRTVLRNVDLFIHYFTDLGDYERYYGISPARSKYVPFKANLPQGIPGVDEVSGEGDYVITAGRSRRDLDTFLRAMARVRYPGILLHDGPAVMRANDSALNLSCLPPNVRAVDWGGKYDAWVDYIRQAKLVVIPIRPDIIYATGISVYLTAMALQRCVIITEGHSTRNLLTDQAIVVPPSDPAALSEAIQRAWEDDSYRRKIAISGRRYAEQLGDEARLMRDVVDICGELVYAAQSQSPPASST